MRGTVALAAGLLVAGLVAPVVSAGAQESAAGTVQGTVTSYAGAPVAGVKVHLYSHDEEGLWDPAPLNTGLTDENGLYTLSEVPVGTYRLLFERDVFDHSGHQHAGGDPEFAYEFWPDADNVKTGGDVVVTSGGTTRIDPVLERSRSLTADITLDGGPANYVMLNIEPHEPVNTFWVARAETSGGGVTSFILRGLRPGGVYDVDALWKGPDDVLRREIFSDAVWTDSATPVRIPVSGPDPHLTIYLGEPDPRIENTSPPSTTGRARVGDVVTARPGTWDTDGVSFSYQWFANLVPVEGATSRRFRIPRELAGKALTFEVTAAAVASGLAPGKAMSAATGGVERRPYDATVVVRGRSRVGSVLQLVVRSREKIGASASIRWYAGKRVVSTAPGVRVKRSMLGKRLRAKVTFTHPYRTTVTRTTPYTARVRR